MTEMSPIGSVANLPTPVLEQSEDVQLEYRAKQGYPVPFVEIRARGDEDDFIPWDGESMGELEVRGPWVASSYYEAPEGADKFTDDGWFKTGDIVTIDQYGFIKITDRSKDLIKSGGEWISSVELENALMSHEAVSQAAVIAIPHEKWDERPLAAIVLKEGESATGDDLQSHLEKDFAKFWLPDAYEFVESIPMTATGKFQKLKLREQFEGYTADGS
jgi:fatty-acyl-CoA synthase